MISSSAAATALIPPVGIRSCRCARWMTPSEAAAASLTPSRSSRWPRCTLAPSAAACAAALSDRARAVTSWPAAIRSEMMYGPEWPVPPVTKTRICVLLVGDGVREKVLGGVCRAHWRSSAPPSTQVSRWKVMAVVQVLDQAGLNGVPAKSPAGDGVRRGEVQCGHCRQEPKVARQHQLVRGDAHGGYSQASGYSLGDLAERDSLVADRVPGFACGSFLERQAEQRGKIADVHGGPAVLAVSRIAGETLCFRERDQLQATGRTV